MANKEKKPIGYRSKQEMVKFIDKSLDRNQEFIFRAIGNRSEVELSERILKTKDQGNYISGSHISRLMLLDIEKRLSENSYVPKNTDPARRRINTIMYDPENIKKYQNIPMAAIDIKGCYWNTAKKLGVISNDLYEKGMKGGDKWKRARNAAIGSLNAEIREYMPKNGELVFFNSYRRPYNCVRLDIIDHVWEIACNIGEAIKDDFLFYLTDCFFVTKQSQQKVIDMLEKNGYASHAENIMINNVLESKYQMTIHWETRKQLNKYHHFRKFHKVPWKK